MTAQIGTYSNRFLTKKPKKQFLYISWCGTVLSIAGAFLVASGFFAAGYAIFGAGALCWIYEARRMGNNAMLFLELVFLCSNVYGFFNLGF